MEELKIKGNDCLRAGNIEEAIEFYTEAINLEPTAILFSNRSNAFLKLNKHYEAFRDANQAIMLNPSWSKVGSVLLTHLAQACNRDIKFCLIL